MEQTKHSEVLIIGAGMAGLAAARILTEAGRHVRLIDASDGIGGRVRTDHIDGFLLDRGFQVLLTAYPEAKQMLDYGALELKSFSPGALILNEQGKSMIGDPLREPATLVKTLLSPAGSMVDKLRMLQLKIKLSNRPLDEIFSGCETSTLKYLQDFGFSKKMIDQFFKPFMSGIFLENQLHTSSRMFEFVFKMFSEADTAIPAKGMGMIAQQLASKLRNHQIVLNERVLEINANQVITHTGKTYTADRILIATDETNVPVPLRKTIIKPFHSVINMYFAAPKAPYANPLIALNASRTKIVNNIAVMTQISDNYGNGKESLVSLSVLDQPINIPANSLQEAVISELKTWFPEATNWRHIKTYSIPYALPNDEQVQDQIGGNSIRLSEICFMAGDHLLNGSIHAAFKSGRLAAEAILASWK